MTSNLSPANFLLSQKKVFLDDPNGMRTWGSQWLEFFGRQPCITQTWLARLDKEGILHWTSNSPSQNTLPPFPEDSLQHTVASRKICVLQLPKKEEEGALIPLKYGGQVIGLLGLLSNHIDHFIKSDVIELATSLSPIIARGFFEEDDQARRTQAETSISRLLQSSLDAQNVMPTILKILSGTLDADALLLLWHNPSTKEFEALARYGWETPFSQRSGSIEETFLKGRSPIWIEDLQTSHFRQKPIQRMNTAGIRGYAALPLIGHNELSGILEIVWQTPRKRQTQELDFLERMAEQIAFVMERSAMLKDLRQVNQSLTLGYDALIEGLSRTLELRDFETEGHTRRVSLLTMRLLEHMNIPYEQWEIIRRGALLHDIGKLGIPDAILLKPGSLTDEEKRMMQLHVVYGYNILTPIINVKQILDIVLYHHERWDGTGYPNGLAETQIPLVARLFAVVDVFDALTTDRPYRTAWSHTQAIDYLKEQAGKQFDAQVVKYFLQIATDTP